MGIVSFRLQCDERIPGRCFGDDGRATMKYTCSEYREEMTLLALQKQLSQTGLSEEERKRISDEIKKLEAKMDMA